MDEQRSDATPAPEQGDGAGAAVIEPGPARRQVAVEVGVEGDVRFDGIDSAQLREVLARLGAQGSSELSGLSARGLIEVVKRLGEMSGAIAAVQARALVELEESVKADSRARGEDPGRAVKVARLEASAALKLSPSTAGHSLSSSRRLVASMPEALRALAGGRITAQVAHQCGRTLGPVDPALRRRVDRILFSRFPELEGAGPRQWAQEVEAIAHALDPAGATRRHRRARTDRHVTIRPGDHGMAHLSASLPGLDAARIRKGLSLAAEKARAHGDRRGHQQIMADLLADQLLGRGDGLDPGGLDIGVIITDRSLLAPRHADAATIEGYGTVPYEHIRDALRTAMDATDGDAPAERDLAVTMRRLYTHPTSGELVAVESRAEAFPDALARFVRWSHRTCRGPYCNADLRQTDHITPRSRGGRTALINANGLCAQCNQKEEAGLGARAAHDPETGARTVTWTTRYGQTMRGPTANHDPVGTARATDRPPPLVELCPDTGMPLPRRSEEATALTRSLRELGVRRFRVRHPDRHPLTDPRRHAAAAPGSTRPPVPEVEVLPTPTFRLSRSVQHLWMARRLRPPGGPRRA